MRVVRLESDTRLFIEVAGTEMGKRLARLKIVLQELCEHARENQIMQ
jgi:hypothetical protein